MVRSGGLFLILIGLGLLGALAFSGAALVNYGVFYVGAGLAVLSLFFASRFSFGTPRRLQISALAAAVTLQAVLFIAMARVLPPGTAEHVKWLWVSIIVGIHFLPMALCFGPRFLLLGAALIVNAGVGLWLAAVPYEVFGVVDGLLKVGMGVWLFSTPAPQRSRASPR